MADIIFVTLFAVLVFCAFWFGPTRTYYVLKYAFFKPIEWMSRAFIALTFINYYVWLGFGLLIFAFVLVDPQQNIRFWWMTALFVYVWLIAILAVRNFRDKDDRDFVRMLLARVEHKFCFGNSKLSIYPDDWPWFD